MRALLLLPLLTACAHAPAELTAAKASVDSRLEYAHYYGDNRPAHLEAHEVNCKGFSKAYEAELRQANLKAVRFICLTPDGEPHMAVVSGEWVLDNRYSAPVALKGYDCNPI